MRRISLVGRVVLFASTVAIAIAVIVASSLIAFDGKRVRIGGAPGDPARTFSSPPVEP